jgi:hypothetical protein
MMMPFAYCDYPRPNPAGRQKAEKEITDLLVKKGLTPETGKFREVMRRHMAKPKYRKMSYYL